MATGDMRLSLDFVDHPKIRRLIRKAGYEGFYCLIKLFSMAGKIYQKGVLKGCSVEDIEDLCDWRGEQGDFIAALLSVHLLEPSVQGYSIHDWDKHQPWLYHADQRSEQAKKAIEARWAKKRQDEQRNSDTHCIQPEDDSNTESNTLSNTLSNTPLPLPYPSPLPSPQPLPIHDKSDREAQKNKNAAFSKPTLEDIEAYCKERANKVEAHRFLSYYESNGWKVGKNPMKDWKAAIRTWERGSHCGFGAQPANRNRKEGFQTTDIDGWTIIGAH